MSQLAKILGSSSYRPFTRMQYHICIYVQAMPHDAAPQNGDIHRIMWIDAYTCELCIKKARGWDGMPICICSAHTMCVHGWSCLNVFIHTHTHTEWNPHREKHASFLHEGVRVMTIYGDKNDQVQNMNQWLFLAYWTIIFGLMNGDPSLRVFLQPMNDKTYIYI